MNEKLFPKPQPANPLPLDVWLERTDRAESGREAFFVGEKRNIMYFKDRSIALMMGLLAEAR